MIKIKFSKKQVNLFKKLGIETIYLFGSHAQGNPNPLSDFDFGIVLANPEKYKEKTLDIYLKLYDIFTEILPKR